MEFVLAPQATSRRAWGTGCAGGGAAHSQHQHQHHCAFGGPGLASAAPSLHWRTHQHHSGHQGRAAEGPAARTRCRVVASALFSPPSFQPDKLTVFYIASDGSCSERCATPPRLAGARLQRRYTLTHNDLTGALKLTIGEQFNHAQISGFYTRLLRDEVVAEWQSCSASGRPSLHVYLHVSGEERWLAPPQLRDYIFRRELPLVLDTFLYADRELLQQQPELAGAEVFVHFQSCKQELDTIERWGVLGQRSTWRPMPQSMLQRLLEPVLSLAGDAAQQEQQQPQAWLEPQSQVAPWAQPPSSSNGHGGLGVPLATAAASSNGSTNGSGGVLAPAVSVPCACSSEAQQEQPLLTAAPAACECGSLLQGSQEAIDAAPPGTLLPTAAMAAGEAAVPQHRRGRRRQQQGGRPQQPASQHPQGLMADLSGWGAPVQQQQQQQEAAPAPWAAAGSGQPPSRQVYVQGMDDDQLASSLSAPSSTQPPPSSSNGHGSTARKLSQQQQQQQQQAVAVGVRGAALEPVQELVAAVPVPSEVGSQVVLDRLAAVAVPIPVMPMASAVAAAASGRLVSPLGR